MLLSADSRSKKMPAKSFGSMTVEALMELRAQVVEQLAKRRAQLEAQIEQISGNRAAPRRGRPPGSERNAPKGRKLPPKYRGPKGETWAGRGATPVWLAVLIKQGRKKEEFAIDKSVTPVKRAAAKRTKRSVKRSRRKK
jgi:DNA-binding protein H-NS